MRHLPAGLTALLAVIASTPSRPHAAEPTDGMGSALRWPEVAAAADRHPALQEATARARSAEGATSAAGAIPNPTFGVSAGDGRPRGGGAGRREWGASVELPLDVLATRGARVAAARASEDGARQEARATRAEVLRELRRDFVALAHSQAVVESGTELEAQAAQLAALVRRRAERGEGRPSEVPRVEIELERLRGALERDRAVAQAARQRLSLQLGAPVGRLDVDLASTLALPPLDEIRARVLETSPLVLSARARARAAEQEASAERWERLPKLTVGGAHVEELDRTASTATASLTFPLWNWNQGRVHQAQATAEAERARTAAASRSLAANLGDAWQGCSSGQAAARRFQAEILPRAEKSARTLGRAFELGEAGLLDVIDARRVLLDTRREYLDLLLDMQNACADFAALAGLELP